MPTTFYTIQPQYEHPPAGDNVRLSEVLDRMAAMEVYTMGFLGLTDANTYGHLLPEKLGPTFPQVIHLPHSGTGASIMMGPFTFGASNPGASVLAAHPGGKWVNTARIEIDLFIDRRVRNLRRLSAETLYWVDAFAQAYARNGSLSGGVKGAKLTQAGWGPITYGGKPGEPETEYFGWKFLAEIRMEFSYRAEG